MASPPPSHKQNLEFISRKQHSLKRDLIERTSFLIDAREATLRSHLPSQLTLFKDLYDGDCFIFTSPGEETSYFTNRGSYLSFLIVVDNMDLADQFNALAVMDILNKFSNNLSIDTTHDFGVLETSAGTPLSSYLNRTDRNEAKDLLSWHALCQAEPCSESKVAAGNFVDVCGGLVLSIELRVRNVNAKALRYWSSGLIEVIQMLHWDVKQRFTISFDSLNDEQKQVFMDVACFFGIKAKTLGATAWEVSGRNSQYALQTLKDKCAVEEAEMLNLNTYEGLILRSHDHRREFGRRMAFEHSPHRRLWFPQDLTVMATSQLKDLKFSQTLVKEFPEFLEMPNNLENVFLDARRFPIQGLTMLKSLGMNISSLCVRFCTLMGEHASTKRGEKVLCESLVILNFKFKGDFDWINGKTPMLGLKKLEISGDECLSKVFISGIHYPMLESIKFHCMEILMEVDLTGVIKLNCIDIRNCQKLQRFTAATDLPNLVLLNISQCQELKQLGLGHMSSSERTTTVDCKHPTCGSIENLVAQKVTDCTELAAFDNFNCVSRLPNHRMLTELNISECPELKEVTLGDLSSLEKLTIEKCNHLDKLSGISNLGKLTELKLSDCEKLEFECLRLSGMKCLKRIKFGKNVMVRYFELDGCPNLKTTEFCYGKLVELSIRSCPQLKEMPAFIGPSCLERIRIDGCGKFDFFRLNGCPNLKSVSGNTEIRCLYITDCPELRDSLNLAAFSCLEQIEIKHCEKLQNISVPTTLMRLSIQSCGDLRSVSGTYDLMELVQFEISDCGKLEFEYSWEDKEHAPLQLRELIISGTWSASFQGFPSSISYLNHLKKVALLGDKRKVFGIKGLPEEFCDLQYLEHLELRHCTLLSSLPARFGDLRNLRHLDLCSCKDLRMLPVSFQQLKHLRHLDLSGCKRLVFQKDILENITELENLYLSGCLALQKIPDQITDQACLKELQLQSTILENLPNDIGQLSKLEVLTIGSPLLKSLPDSFGNLSSLRSLSITDCLALESLPKALVHLVHLEHLCLEATGVRSLPEGFLQLSNLRKLKISDCPLNDLDFGSVSSFSLENLTEINLSETLVTRISISEHCCPSLETLQLSKNDYLEVIEALPATVSKIELSECETLKSIKGIRALRIPPCLVISNCPKDFEEP